MDVKKPEIPSRESQGYLNLLKRANEVNAIREMLEKMFEDDKTIESYESDN